MENGNSWNSHAHNQSEFARQRNYGNNQKKKSHSHNKAGNNRQQELLEELVQQNHTIIGLLRGIKHALTDEEQVPKKKSPQTEKKQSPKKSVVKETVVEKATVESPKNQEKSEPKVRKQFVMRFDDKKPLNKDLDDVVEAATKAVENNVAVVSALESDENSVGERDAFELFGAPKED